MQKAKLINWIYKSHLCLLIYMLIFITYTLIPYGYVSILLQVIASCVGILSVFIFPKYSRAYDAWKVYKDFPNHNSKACVNVYKHIGKLSKVYKIDKVTVFVFGSFWFKNYEYIIHES